MTRQAAAARRIQVFYDGRCGFCTASMQRLRSLDRRRILDFRDLNEDDVAADAAPRFSRADLAREMHIRLPDDTWRTGYFAVVEILRRVVRCNFIRAALLFPPVAELGHAAYKCIARCRRTGAACASGTCNIGK